MERQEETTQVIDSRCHLVNLHMDIASPLRRRYAHEIWSFGEVPPSTSWENEHPTMPILLPGEKETVIISPLLQPLVEPKYILLSISLTLIAFPVDVETATINGNRYVMNLWSSNKIGLATLNVEGAVYSSRILVKFVFSSLSPLHKKLVEKSPYYFRSSQWSAPLAECG